MALVKLLFQEGFSIFSNIPVQQQEQLIKKKSARCTILDVLNTTPEYIRDIQNQLGAIRQSSNEHRSYIVVLGGFTSFIWKRYPVLYELMLVGRHYNVCIIQLLDGKNVIQDVFAYEQANTVLECTESDEWFGFVNMLDLVS